MMRIDRRLTTSVKSRGHVLLEHISQCCIESRVVEVVKRRLLAMRDLEFNSRAQSEVGKRILESRPGGNIPITARTGPRCFMNYSSKTITSLDLIVRRNWLILRCMNIEGV